MPDDSVDGCRVYRWIACLGIVLFLATAPAAMAQIHHKSVKEHKKQRKKFLKQAKSLDAQYKDTHLDVNSSHTFKIGESGRKRSDKEVQQHFQFNESGEPVKKKKRIFWKKKGK